MHAEKTKITSEVLILERRPRGKLLPRSYMIRSKPKLLKRVDWKPRPSNSRHNKRNLPRRCKKLLRPKKKTESSRKSRRPSKDKRISPDN